MAKNFDSFRYMNSGARSGIRAAKKLLEALAEIGKDCNNPLYKSSLEKIMAGIEEEEQAGNGFMPPFIEVQPQYMPTFIQILKENHVDFVPFDMEGKDEKCIIYNPKDAEIVDLCRQKALLEKGKLYEVPYTDFMAASFKENIVVVPAKDEIWLDRFDLYARHNNLNYTINKGENGEKELIVKEKDREKLNRALFSTNWSLSGKYKNIAAKESASRIERKDRYAERLNNIEKEGGVYLVNADNVNESICIRPDGYTRYFKDTIVEEKEAHEMNYRLNLNKQIGQMGHDYMLFNIKEYEEAQDKGQLFKEKYREEGRVFIRRDILKEMQHEEYMKQEVMKNIDFSKDGSFSSADAKTLREQLLYAFTKAKEDYAYAVEMSLKSGEPLPEAFELVYGHLNETMMECNRGAKGSKVEEVDLTRIDLGSIQTAKENAIMRSLESLEHTHIVTEEQEKEEVEEKEIEEKETEEEEILEEIVFEEIEL